MIRQDAFFAGFSLPPEIIKEFFDGLTKLEKSRQPKTNDLSWLADLSSSIAVPIISAVFNNYSKVPTEIYTGGVSHEPINVEPKHEEPEVEVQQAKEQKSQRKYPTYQEGLSDIENISNVVSHTGSITEMMKLLSPIIGNVFDAAHGEKSSTDPHPTTQTSSSQREIL